MLVSLDSLSHWTDQMTPRVGDLVPRTLAAGMIVRCESRYSPISPLPCCNLNKLPPIPRCVEHGTNETCVLVGPPGCGKTLVARHCIKAVSAMHLDRQIKGVCQQ